MSSKASASPKSVINSILKKSGKSPRFVVILGQDQIRRQRVIDLLAEGLWRGKDKPQLLHIQSDNLDRKALLNLAADCEAMDLFFSNKFYVIQNAQKLKAEQQKELLKVANAAGSNCVFFIAATQLPAKNSMATQADKEGCLIELPALSGAKLLQWTASEFKNNGINNFSTQVLSQVVELTEGSCDQIANVTLQLSLYVEGDEVTLDDVKAMFPAHSSFKEFDLIDSLSRKQLGKSEYLLSSLLSQGSNEFGLLALLHRNIFNLFAIKLLSESGWSQPDIRRTLNMNQWVFNKNWDNSARFSINKLRQMLKEIIKTDCRLKNASIGPEALFSNLNYKLTENNPLEI